jgi:hypothetical protein
MHKLCDATSLLCCGYCTGPVPGAEALLVPIITTVTEVMTCQLVMLVHVLRLDLGTMAATQCGAHIHKIPWWHGEPFGHTFCDLYAQE